MVTNNSKPSSETSEKRETFCRHLQPLHIYKPSNFVLRPNVCFSEHKISADNYNVSADSFSTEALYCRYCSPLKTENNMNLFIEISITLRRLEFSNFTLKCP